jgi:hypothetical protein
MKNNKKYIYEILIFFILYIKMSRLINIIDPQHFTATHSCEFRLNKTNVAYLTNGAYLCLGAHGTNATVNQVHYNRRAGIAGMVESIRLLNGGDVLAQLDNAGTWMAWKGLNQDNANARSRKQMSYDSAGILRFGIDTEGSVDAGYQQVLTDSEETTQLGSLGTSEAVASVGSMELKSFLKELEVLTVLPTAIFTNLRLEIRWNTDILKVCKEFANGADAAVSAIQAVRPLLVIESIEDQDVIAQMMQGMSQMNFTCIESDRFVLPAIADGARTTGSFVLRGFNDKVVNRVLIANTPTGGADGFQGIKARAIAADGTYLDHALDSGALNSLAQNRYTLQCRVNGQSLFTGRGLGFDDTIGGTGGAGYNHRLALTTDTWGDVAICQAGNTVGLVFGMGGADNAENNANYFEGLVQQPERLFFGSDYTGFRVMDRVSHLEFDITRTGLPTQALPIANSEDFNQSINEIVFAEIPKVLQISGMDYRVSYL